MADAPSAHFPPDDRLRRRAEFERVYREGRRASSAKLMVWGAPNGLDRSRIGLSVSRNAGNAVRRNRIKRLLRESFRLNRGRLPSGLDLVVSPARSVRNPAWKRQDVEEELVRLAAVVAPKPPPA